jgi:hypothetical protein
MAKPVRMAASRQGSLWWEVAATLKDVLGDGEFSLDIDWTTFDHLNVRAVGSGKCDIGVTMPPCIDWANRRRGLLADTDFPALYVIAAVNLSMWLVSAVDADTGFTKLRDIGQARFAWKPIMPPADQLLRGYGERVLELHGFSTAAIKSWGGDDPVYTPRDLRHEEQADGLPGSWIADRPPVPLVTYTKQLSDNGLANGLFVMVNLNSPWATGLSVLRELQFLELEEPALRTVASEFGTEILTLPQRIFRGVDRDLLTIGWRHQYIYGREDTDPRLVHAILAALEHPEFLDNAYGASYTAVEPELVPGVELHPASRSWYERRRAGGLR